MAKLFFVPGQSWFNFIQNERIKPRWWSVQGHKKHQQPIWTPSSSLTRLLHSKHCKWITVTEKLQSQLWYYQLVVFHQESHLSFYMFLCLSSRSWDEPVQGGAREGSETLSIFLQHHVQQETANWSVKQGCSLQVATSWAHMPLNSLWQVRSQCHGEMWRPAGNATHAGKRAAHHCRTCLSHLYHT